MGPSLPKGNADDDGGNQEEEIRGRSRGRGGKERSQRRRARDVSEEDEDRQEEGGETTRGMQEVGHQERTSFSLTSSTLYSDLVISHRPPLLLYFD